MNWTARKAGLPTVVHCVGVALIAAWVVAVAGCASMHTRDVLPDAPQLPPAAVERRPQTVGIYFSDEFRAARPEHTVDFLGSAQSWRHALGAASVETFRQALAASFTQVIELAEPPDAAGLPPGMALVVVPEPPTVQAEFDEKAVVTIYRQTVRYPVTLLEAGTAAPRKEFLQGSTATGTHGVGFLSQKALDESMLRSAGASLVALFSLMPGAQHASPIDLSATAPPPRSTNSVALLRLDAGMPRGDGIERRVGACLSRAVDLPAKLAGEQPGAALRDALFPWLDPGVAPEDTEGISALLSRPSVQARLAALGVSKLVLFTARDVEPREKRNMYCAAGYNAGACFGLYESRTGYAVDVTVWDVDRREPLATDRTRVLQRIGAVGLLIPIPYFSSNETEACEQMQEYVRRVFVR